MTAGLTAVGLGLVGVMVGCVTAAGAGPPVSTGEIGFDHPGGYCREAFSLVLSASATNAAIYYTTNGVEPSPGHAERYLHPLAIHSTTIVLAAAFDEQANGVGTGARTFLFAEDILKQTGGHFPKTWGMDGGRPVLADYAMATVTEADAVTRSKVVAGLQSLAIVCIIADPASLFSADYGIYAHPLERGNTWERGVAVELYEANREPAFHYACGLRIHGGTSREPKESPKHSFRLSFKQRYGLDQLRFPVFGPGGARTFDSLILRAGNNDSWLAGTGESPRPATYLRDEWMRRSMLEMRHPSARGRFVQLYLNGLYWGLYDLCERPGPDLLAGEADGSVEHDVRKGSKMEDGDNTAWNHMMALANAGVGEDRTYEEICQRLDVNEFADYMILNFYAGNSDWDRAANWYAIRPRTDSGRFQFLAWDGECTLGGLEADTLALDDDDSPQRLFHKLAENAAFRKLFATRAQLLLFNDGALAPEKSRARFQKLVEAVAPAMVAEAARWGNYRRVQPVNHPAAATGDRVVQEWRPEVNRILYDYFPNRRERVLNQFRERGLYGDADQRQ